MGEERKVHKVLVEKPEGKRPLGRPTLKWDDGIIVDHVKIGPGLWSGFKWLKIGTNGGFF
jgi:hypothetical protein